MATNLARKAAEVEAANDTFETLAREWHTSRLSGWDAGTAKRMIGALERHVFPELGKRPYTGILSMEWMSLLRALEKQGILEQMSRVTKKTFLGYPWKPSIFGVKTSGHPLRVMPGQHSDW
ncbi:hypothetical protein SAMN04487857_11322 [Pseudomonas sp. ok272]|nr:hypothetical protein SAMN04487857_11322 [Pseudomonas sp. ok272]SFN20871.1 hypothetical protein SAMN04487858_114148 [Pseudomonas sp. ok602]